MVDPVEAVADGAEVVAVVEEVVVGACVLVVPAELAIVVVDEVDEAVEVVFVDVVAVVVEVVVAVCGSPITSGVPVRAETGMSPQTIPSVLFVATVSETEAAWAHEPPAKKSIMVLLPTYELEMQTRAVPPVTPETLTS